MIDTITQWINALVLWLDTIPPGVLAILTGIVIGGLSTQWLKRTFPPTVLLGLDEGTAVMVLRILAFVFSAVPTYYMWPTAPPASVIGPDHSDKAIWAALFVGFATPTIYKIATFLLYKRFPKLEERLSGTTGTTSRPTGTGDGQ